MNSPNAFKVAGAIRSRLDTIFHLQGYTTIPVRDIELMSQMVRDHRLPAGWLDRIIKQAMNRDSKELRSA